MNDPAFTYLLILAVGLPVVVALGVEAAIGRRKVRREREERARRAGWR